MHATHSKTRVSVSMALSSACPVVVVGEWQENVYGTVAQEDSHFDRDMSEEEQDPYALLDLKVEATDAEIRKAYRQRSLKVHPDRVSTSYTVLMDSTSSC